MKEKVIVTIRRRYEPGDSNIKGKAYSINSYKNAIEKLNEKIKNKELGAELVVGLSYDEYMNMFSDERNGIRKINKENVCGTIVEINDKFIKVELKADLNIIKLFEYYEHFKIKPEACMRYLAEKSIFAKEKNLNIIDIITFDIVFPKINKDLTSLGFIGIIKTLCTKYKGVCYYKDIYKD